MHAILRTTFSFDHICAELFWSLALDVVLVIPIRWAVRRHDQKRHG